MYLLQSEFHDELCENDLRHIEVVCKVPKCTGAGLVSGIRVVRISRYVL